MSIILLKLKKMTVVFFPELSVNENVRKNGIGKMLLGTAEIEAKSKGCRTILVRSENFQVPQYKKYGFKARCVLDNFPEGYDYYF